MVQLANTVAAAVSNRKIATATTEVRPGSRLGYLKLQSVQQLLSESPLVLLLRTAQEDENENEKGEAPQGTGHPLCIGHPTRGLERCCLRRGCMSLGGWSIIYQMGAFIMCILRGRLRLM